MADEVDLIAGEYVLGTLDAAERAHVERRILSEPAMALAVARWQERLAPIALSVADVAPPEDFFRRIEALTGPGTAPVPAAANDNRVALWRGVAVAASMVAVLVSALALRPAPAPEAAPQIAVAPSQAMMTAVAALSADGAPPAMLVTYEADRSRIQIVPVSMEKRPGRSLELWVIEGAAAPRSMGTMADSGKPAFRGVAIDPKTETMFAVSVEPIGGSPTGAPTGPVVYSGKMTAVPSGT